jgi:hypothetical protein
MFNKKSAMILALVLGTSLSGTSTKFDNARLDLESSFVVSCMKKGDNVDAKKMYSYCTCVWDRSSSGLSTQRLNTIDYDSFIKVVQKHIPVCIELLY